MSGFETTIKDQIIIEFPEMADAGAKFKIQDREFDGIDQLTHYVAGEMWNAFDSTLFQVESA